MAARFALSSAERRNAVLSRFIGWVLETPIGVGSGWVAMGWRRNLRRPWSINVVRFETSSHTVGWTRSGPSDVAHFHPPCPRPARTLQGHLQRPHRSPPQDYRISPETASGRLQESL
jgi:hypothetical protein